MNEVPTNMEGCYKAASRLDNQGRRFKMVVAGLRDPLLRHAGKNPRNEESGTDPDAMDVDRLTFGERQKLRREGRCFLCKEKGHRVSDCPQNKDKKPSRNPQSGRYEKRNMRATTKEDEVGKEPARNSLHVTSELALDMLSVLTNDKVRRRG